MHDDDETIVLIAKANIDLIKSKAPSQGDTVSPGDIVNYIITVRNRGNTSVDNLIVEDHFPLGLQLNDSNWTLVSGATRVARFNTNLSLNAGDQRQIPIQFKVAQDASGLLRNLAVVCEDDGSICDPETPPTCEDSEEE